MSAQVRDYHTKNDFSADHASLSKGVRDGAVDEATVYGSDAVSQSIEFLDPPQDFVLYDAHPFADPPGDCGLIEDREALLAALLGFDSHREVEKPVDPYDAIDAIMMGNFGLEPNAEFEAEFNKWQASSGNFPRRVDTGGLPEPPAAALVSSIELYDGHEQSQRSSAPLEHHKSSALQQTPAATASNPIIAKIGHEQPQAETRNPQHRINISAPVDTPAIGSRIEVCSGLEQSQARSEPLEHRITFGAWGIPAIATGRIKVRDGNEETQGRSEILDHSSLTRPLEMTATQGEVARSSRVEGAGVISGTPEQRINADDLLQATTTSVIRRIEAQKIEAQAITNAMHRYEALGSFTRTFIPDQTPKRPRGSDGERGVTNSKRQKVSPSTPSEVEAARDQELWVDNDSSNGEGSDRSGSMRQKTPIPIPTVTKGTRAHPAAVLFKSPSEASKKYKRAPISKLFTSLELLPDDFLELQAEAKIYMLDEDHPERYECIGTQSRANADITKLRLLDTTRAFLEDEGWGQRCFGQGTLEFRARKLKWPEHRNQLISLVSTLLHRVLRNERQRRYALEARNEKQRSITPTRKLTASPEPPKSNLPTSYNTKIDQNHSSVTPAPKSATSLKSQNSKSTTRCSQKIIQTSDSAPPSPVSNATSSPNSFSALSMTPGKFQCPVNIQSSVRPDNLHSPLGQQNGITSSTPTVDSIRYHVNYLINDRRIKQLVLTPTTCPGFLGLLRYIHRQLCEGGQNLLGIRVLGPEGLREVKDDKSWDEVVASIKKNEWMDGDVKCIVDLEESNASPEIPAVR